MPFPWFDKRERQEPDQVLPVSAIGTSDARPGQKKKSVSFNKITWASFWAAFKERLGSGSALSESLLLESGDLDLEKINPAFTPVPALTANENNTPADEDEGPIDEVVVDNLMSSDETTHRTPTDLLVNSTGGSPEKPVPSHESRPGTAVTENDASLSTSEFAWIHSVWTALRWRFYPAIQRFFFLQFQDEAMEAQFSREAWFTTKQLALWARYTFHFHFNHYSLFNSIPTQFVLRSELDHWLRPAACSPSLDGTNLLLGCERLSKSVGANLKL